MCCERDLDQNLLDPYSYNLAPPGAGVSGEIELLIHDYGYEQTQNVDALLSSHGEGPSLRRAHAVLRDGGLLDPLTLAQLPSCAAKDAESRSEQHQCRQEYMAWREQAARKLARQAGPLGRLTHRPEEFYTQLDTQKLRVCRACTEVIYPTAERSGTPEAKSCHYCNTSHNSPIQANSHRHRHRKRGQQVSSPQEIPGGEDAVCPASGRRRVANVPRQPRARADRRNEVCATGPLTRRGDIHDAATPIDTASELEGFANWFADWWLRRGRDLTATTATHPPGGASE